ncbi:hypothetical protein GZH53_09175 [Flavihumibacter sp. R14]|nr:hypothetical protein [Flavihumibacter soli]
MQSSHHKKQSPDELIDYIRESLVENAEPYAPGAWENFNRQESTKRSGIFWRRILSSAAALLLIGNGIYLFYNLYGNNTPVEVTKTKQYNEPEYQQPRKANRERVDTPVVNNMRSLVSTKLNQAIATDLDIPIHAPDKTAALSEESELSLTGVDTSGLNVVALNVPKFTISGNLEAMNANSQKLVHLDRPKKDFVNFLKNEMIREGLEDSPQPINEAKDKWGFKVAVVPAYGASSKLTLGYSLNMLYALSDKVSLTSGIGYSELGGAKDYKQPESSILLDTKILESSRENYAGIDLPLGVSYNFSKRVYANAGVSAFAVIDQSRYNHFSESKLVERTVRTASGQEERMTFIDNEKTVEKVHDSQIEKAKYLGMYNFSMGYKQRILKTMNISVEPFLKVPVTRSSHDEMRHVATGVRLSLDL